MTCELIQSRLTAYLDGELPAEATTEIEAHLQTCPNCAEAQEALAALSETLSAWAVSAPDITSSVMQAITADEVALLRTEMHELRAEIRLLRVELSAQRRLHEDRPAPPSWFPVKTAHYTRLEEDPWNLVRS